jgi:hypothetical protein
VLFLTQIDSIRTDIELVRGIVCEGGYLKKLGAFLTSPHPNIPGTSFGLIETLSLCLVVE